MSLITVENLSVKYGTNFALKKINLEIKSGEIVTIVGPNGSGKTSLLKAIIGAVQPADGKITIKSKLKIGYIPQRLNFDTTLPITVERFMTLTEKVDKSTYKSALDAKLEEEYKFHHSHIRRTFRPCSRPAGPAQLPPAPPLEIYGSSIQNFG